MMVESVAVTATDIHRTIDTVWRMESPKIIAALTRLVRDVGLAEELAQEAMVRVLGGLSDLRSPQSVVYWAFRIFSTVAGERAEAERAEAAAVPQSDGPPPEAPDPSDVASEVEQAAADGAPRSRPLPRPAS